MGRVGLVGLVGPWLLTVDLQAQEPRSPGCALTADDSSVS
jgi:hypothetical protein